MRRTGGGNPSNMAYNWREEENVKKRGFGDDAAGRRQMWKSQTEEMLENSTNNQIDELHSQVRDLKQISTDIHVEIGKSNLLLDELHNTVDDTEGLLGAAMKKLKQISESGSNKLMLYLVIFVVVVFLMIYFAISWTRKPS